MRGENLQKPARGRRAYVMLLFCHNQEYSTSLLDLLDTVHDYCSRYFKRILSGKMVLSHMVLSQMAPLLLSAILVTRVIPATADASLHAALAPASLQDGDAMASSLHKQGLSSLLEVQLLHAEPGRVEADGFPHEHSDTPFTELNAATPQDLPRAAERPSHMER